MRHFCLLFLVFCCQLSFTQDLNYSSLLIDKDLTVNANAIVRQDEMTVKLASVKKMSIHLKRIVTVLNKHGNKHTHTSVGYNNSLKVEKVEAFIYDALGNEIGKIKEKEFKDISAVDGGTLYTDSRILYMDYTPVQYPYTVVFSYEVSTENTANIPSWYFLDGFLISTQKSTYKVEYSSPDLKPQIKEKNLEGIKVKRIESQNSIAYEASNINAIKEESLSPSFSKIAPKLMVRAENFHYEGYEASLIKDWKELGNWMNDNLLKNRSELPEVTKLKVRSLVQGVADPLEKAKIIYNYIQNNTRYISVQVGIGGIQPISAIEVDRVQYGDCKELSNYTKALLEVVGVPSYYTHVESGTNKVDFEEDFADLAQGDHVILAIPYKEKYYWIDCTSQVHPFGFVGDFTDDRQVLVITSEGGELTYTPSYLNDDNYQKTTARYSLNEAGGIAGTISILTKGIQYDNRFFLEAEIPEKIDVHYKNYWGHINNLKLRNYKFKNNREEISFKEELNLEAQNYATKSGDRILFAPNAFNQNSYVPNRYRTRKLPFEIQRGFLDEDEFVISLPEGYEVEAIPEKAGIENEFGAYKMSVTKSETDSTLTYRRGFLIKEGAHASGKYESYRAFRKEVARMDNAQIVIVKNNL